MEKIVNRNKKVKVYSEIIEDIAYLSNKFSLKYFL